MKKTISIVFSVLLVLVVVAVFGIAVFGGAIIKKTVNGVGPILLGVPVTLHDAKFSPLWGRLVLQGLHVGNPKGFKTENLFVADRIDVQVGVKSLLSDTIVIRKILVEAPQITFERGVKNSNIDALMGKTKAPAAAPQVEQIHPDEP